MRFVSGGKKDYQEVTKLYGKLYSKSRSSRFNGIKLLGRVFLAKEKDKVVGFLVATFVSYAASSFGYMEDLLIDESFRGRGVGTQLVKNALKWESAKGAEVVFVTTSRDKACRFYKKLGFSSLKKNKWLMWIPDRKKRNR